MLCFYGIPVFGILFLETREGMASSALGLVPFPTGYAPAREMLRRQPYSEKTDCFSLGASLYHILTGAPAIQGANMHEVRARERGTYRAPERRR